MTSVPTILLIQFRKTPAADRLEFQSITRTLSDAATVKTICGCTEDVLPAVKAVDGVILGGSGDFDFDGARSNDDPVRLATEALLLSLRPTLHYLFSADKPTFGICFGHQLLGAYVGVPVYHDSGQHKQRTHDLVLRSDGAQHDITKGIPIQFAAQYAHKDVLSRVPPGARLLADGGVSCRVPALAYSDRIVSTQFHPELSLSDVHDRVRHIPNYLPDHVSVDHCFSETPHAPRWLMNFAEVCRMGK